MERTESAPVKMRVTTILGRRACALMLSLGALQYFWPGDRTLAFYREAAQWPVDIICPGETVCSVAGSRAWAGRDSAARTAGSHAGRRTSHARAGGDCLGRLLLSFSACCFTARALDVAKDQCDFRCIEYPDGMPLATREGKPFLRIDGIQIQGEEMADPGPQLPVSAGPR